MRLNFYKCAGGVLQPADDHAAEKMTKFKTGEVYPVEIKRARNPQFHKKTFAFLQFCFEHWAGGNEFQDEAAQFDRFRRQLTVIAGYRKELFNIDGSVRFEAESLSYGNMDQQEFEQFAVAMQNAAMRTLFKGADEKTIERLYSFF